MIGTVTEQGLIIAIRQVTLHEENGEPYAATRTFYWKNGKITYNTIRSPK